MNKNIAILSSTPRNNFELAKKLKNQIQSISKDTLVDITELESLDLPLYTPNTEEAGIPPKALTLSQNIQNADALIICAPEYNGSSPPVLSNAICWISRTGGDWRACFNLKLSLICGHSGGGGQKFSQTLRMQLEHLGSLVFPRTILLNNSNPYNENKNNDVLTAFLSCI